MGRRRLRLTKARAALVLASLVAFAPTLFAQSLPLREERGRAALDPRGARADELAERAESALALTPSDLLVRMQLQRSGARPSVVQARLVELALRRRALLDAALDAARAALSLAPAHGRAWFVSARARDLQDAAPAELVGLYRRALDHLADDDQERRAEALFGLGVAHTRLEQHREAREAYEALVSDPSAPGRATALCNLAEVHMYLDDVSSALDRYNECARLLPQRATAFWGLAVAHDRAAHDADARSSADRALSMDSALEDITGEGVFYVPAYERHYYLAVAREAQSRAGAGDASLTSALAAWRAYVSEGGPSAPWLDRVRAHIARIERALSDRARGRALSERGPARR
jgi:tetratricopeptide (TPR) repeat protein